MNIVVVGGGTPGKFGNDFVRRARTEGHRVLVLSHRSRVSNPDTETANFSNVEKTVESFCNLISKFDSIDLFIYNTNVGGESLGGWPNNQNHFKSSSQINENLYIYGFKIHVVIPHSLSIEAMKKMNDRSKICFMATDMIYDRERTKYTERLGYSGGKAYQHQLMLALADHNDKNVIVSSVSPHFNYTEKSDYPFIFDKVYKHIFSHGRDFHRKVFDCWD